jgi:UDP-N-acetylmuramyl tripeptide synthase
MVVVTSDNPRTEQPMDIIDQIVAGFEDEPAIQKQGSGIRGQGTEETAQCNTQYAIRNTKLIEPDRRKAIGLAIETASSNDIVLIAGKGHETYQIIGTQKFDFSDKEVAEQCLESHLLADLPESN